jgi:hypothetical protein
MLLIIFGTILNFYTNDVVIKRADSTIVPTIGMVIQDNDTIIANDSSQAEVLYSDSSTLYIGENSRIVTSGVEKRSVFISIGRVWAKIKRLVRGESFEVKSPLSVSGVLGTEFEASYINDESEIKVVEGKVTAKDRQTGREIILEKEKMAKIRRNTEMEVREFKLQELKRWHQWKKGHLEFLLRKIEEALSQGRVMQASRLIAQGHVLARRLKLTDEYKHKIDKLKKEYENLKEKQGVIEKRIKEINGSYNTIMPNLNRKEPHLMELTAKIKRLSMQATELENYVERQNVFIAKQQLTVVNRQMDEIESLIKNIKPQTIYEWNHKIDNDCQFLQTAQKMPGLAADTKSKVIMTYKRVEELRDRIRKAKIVLVKDMNAYKKIKLELIKLKVETNQR